MDDERLMVLLLPGMDGTGELFADFVAVLPGWIEPRVLSYPREQELSYDQLLPLLNAAVPSGRRYVIVAESFSTPLAVTFAAGCPEGLRALVLCAGFVLPPRRGRLVRLPVMLAPALFSMELPRSVCRRFLVGGSAPTAVVDRVRRAVSKVSGRVLAHRLRSVLSCDAERDLRALSMPLLYIAGSEDRLLSRTSLLQILHAKPGTRVVTMEAPHLVLQVKPQEAAETILSFLRELRLP